MNTGSISYLLSEVLLVTDSSFRREQAEIQGGVGKREWQMGEGDGKNKKKEQGRREEGGKPIT